MSHRQNGTSTSQKVCQLYVRYAANIYLSILCPITDFEFESGCLDSDCHDLHVRG